MSQQPPGPPWPPPNPYGAPGPPGPPPPRSGNKRRFWIGVALTIPLLILAGFVQAAPSALVGVVGGSEAAYQVSGVITLVIGVLLFLLLVAAVVWERTRWYALGVLAGLAILLVLAAGACVVLIVALTSSYG